MDPVVHEGGAEVKLSGGTDVGSVAESFLLQLSDMPTVSICSPSSVTQARKKGAFKQQQQQQQHL